MTVVNLILTPVTHHLLVALCTALLCNTRSVHLSSPATNVTMTAVNMTLTPFRCTSCSALSRRAACAPVSASYRCHDDSCQFDFDTCQLNFTALRHLICWLIRARAVSASVSAAGTTYSVSAAIHCEYGEWSPTTALQKSDSLGPNYVPTNLAVPWTLAL